MLNGAVHQRACFASLMTYDVRLPSYQKRVGNVIAWNGTCKPGLTPVERFKYLSTLFWEL